MARTVLEPEKWVDRYGDYLYNYTIARVSQHEIAQDIISETFLAGLGSRENFKGEASERTWLIAILKRKIIDHYRRSNSAKGRAEVRMDSPGTDADEGDWLEGKVKDASGPGADGDLQNAELGAALLNCMDRLEERQRAIFMRKTIDQHETEALCKEFDITASNLWVIVHRARKAMVECMQKTWLQ